MSLIKPCADELDAIEDLPPVESVPPCFELATLLVLIGSSGRLLYLLYSYTFALTLCWDDLILLILVLTSGSSKSLFIINRPAEASSLNSPGVMDWAMLLAGRITTSRWLFYAYFLFCYSSPFAILLGVPRMLEKSTTSLYSCVSLRRVLCLSFSCRSIEVFPTLFIRMLVFFRATLLLLFVVGSSL